MKKRRILLPIFLLSAFVLGGCATNNKKSSSDSQDTTQYGVEIANKAALEGDWYVGETKDLDLNLTPEANPLLELGKNLTITSSDESVVKVNGLGLSALKVGTAKITVDYHGVKAEVNANIQTADPREKYGTAHEGTAADPFTNEDALLAAKASNYNGEVFYVKGTVASFYNAPGSRTDGMVAYFLEPAQAGGEKFEIYKCFKENDVALTDDDIWVGGIATAYGAFTVYGTQYETSAATFVSCEGEKPQPRTTVDKTFAEALEAVKALADGGDTYDYYRVTGFVSKKDGTNYFLTATKGEAITDVKENTIELYKVPSAVEPKLLKDAKVTITMVLKNYHGQVENGLNITDEQIVVVEPGTDWETSPEPAVTVRTVTEFVAGENVKTVAYSVTGTIKSFKAGETKDKYGNMTITDGTTDLIIYGSTITSSALAWDGAQYNFNNPQDFMTKEETNALTVGQEITMKLIRSDYTKDGSTTIEGVGVITNIGEGGGGGGEQTIHEVSFADALAAGKALANNTSSTDKYKFTGFVTKKDGNNYFLTATKGEEITDVKTNTIELYKAGTVAALADKLLKDAEVTVTMYLKNYSTQVENAVDLVNDDVVVVTAGESWGGNPEPAVTVRTLAQFIAGENVKTVAYSVTAEIKAFNSGSTKNKYGNMTLTDGTNDLTIYGSTITSSALAWDGMQYNFTNPQDFLTKEETNALVIGQEITMKLIRADHNSDVQGTGIITNIGQAPEQQSALVEANFTDSNLHGWTYLPSGSPGYYSGSGIKLNGTGKGVKSPSFAAQSSVKVTVNIASINTNTKTEAGGDHVFTITALDGSGNAAGTAYIDNATITGTGDYNVTISGTGIVQVSIVYSAFYHNGTAYCNLGLGGASVVVPE